MLLIITGTVTPMVKDSELVLKNTTERFEQYVESLLFYIQSGAFHKIIFGENSNFPKEKMEKVYEIAKQNHVSFEYITFQGDAEEILHHGKGYGEGEIMKYVFQNSQFLKGENSFMKITGRLKLVNVKQIVKHCKEGRTYFNIPKKDLRTWYDTRVYVMPIKQFQEAFQGLYQEVDDGASKYLEVVYTTGLVKNQIQVYNLPKFPRIVGVSGSTGANYVYTEWKCKIRDVLSFFQYYHVK